MKVFIICVKAIQITYTGIQTLEKALPRAMGKMRNIEASLES